jgi:predicted enzyme related to lactoylglutathione lyase
MIQKLSHATVYVNDQDSAKIFYVEKLGFEVREDERMGPMRWLTVSPPGQKDLELVLIPIMASPMLGEGDVASLKALLEKGALGVSILLTDDCVATYEELKAKGVEFTAAPTERPYGLEAMLRDDSGNVYSIVQRR